MLGLVLRAEQQGNKQTVGKKEDTEESSKSRHSKILLVFQKKDSSKTLFSSKYPSCKEKGGKFHLNLLQGKEKGRN